MNKFNRLYTVELFKQLNYDQSKEYRQIIELAAAICETPVALITLQDDSVNWVKVGIGVDLEQMPAETSFCRYTINHGALVVENALDDERFCDNPLVTGAPKIRFYGGAALTANSGDRVGSLCVIDVKPRRLTELQLKTLEVLSRQVTLLMELGLSQKTLKEHINESDLRNRQLLNIAQVQSHEFRRPVASILGLMNIIKDENYNASKEYLMMLESAAQELDEKIHLIVEYTQVL